MKPNSDIPHLYIFLTGILVGFFAFEISLTIGSKGLYEVSKDQGSTFAALVTLVTIYLAWKIHRNDSVEQQRRHDDIYARKCNSVRAKMSDAIVDLLKFTNSCYKEIQRARTCANQDVGFNFSFPALPKDAINVFKDGLEFCDINTSNLISELVSGYQICNSRLELNTKNEIHTVDWEDNSICDLVILNYRILKFFAYARKECDEIKISDLNEESIANALRRLMDDDFFVQTKEYNRLFQKAKEDIILRKHSI